MDDIKRFTVEDEDGTTVETVDASEYERLKEESEEKAKEAEELKKQLAGEKDKDKNFGSLRKKTQQAEEEKQQMITKLSDLEKKIVEKEEQDKKKNEEFLDGTLTTYAQGNEELKKKLAFHYNEFAGTPSTMKEVQERVAKAYRLATDEAAPGLDKLNKGFSAHGSGFISKPSEDFMDTEAGKDLSKRLFAGIDMTKQLKK